MTLSAHTLARALRFAADEAHTLTRFLDDLDGWDGADCDTGTNAQLTLALMCESVAILNEDAPFTEALDCAINAGVEHGHGHIGVILTQVLAAWSKGLAGARKITPVLARTMLKTPITDELSRCVLSPAIQNSLKHASSALDELGSTLPETPYLVSWFSLAVQNGLIQETDIESGALDPGAAVLALFFTCVDSALSGDSSVLESFAHMLSELTEGKGRSPRQHAPSPGCEFAVDLVWQGTESDAQALFNSISRVGARFSSVGTIDPFGVGLWRLHVDTSAPLSARPRTGRIIRFAVADSRPDEEIGVDELANEGISHRGVRLLERRPLRRVERARVIVCTRAPGIIEDLARCGAIVLLDPHREDGAGILSIARASSTGVTLFIPCDEPSAALGEIIASRVNRNEVELSAPPSPGGALRRFLLASSHDELMAFTIVQATAGLFVPQPGGPQVAHTMERIVIDAEKKALDHSATRPIDSEDPALIAQAVTDLETAAASNWRLLLSRAHGPELVALVRQFIFGTRSWQRDFEVLMGGQSGPSILERTQI